MSIGSMTPPTFEAADASVRQSTLTGRSVLFLILAITVLAGLTFRSIHLGRQSLWFDEGLTALAASLSPHNIVRYCQSTDAPPLFFMMEHYWTEIFGNSESALRSLSALFGILSIPLFYFFARKVLRDLAAVTLALWLFAFSVMQISFSREARAYEFASFVGLLGLYLLVLFLERRTTALFLGIVICLAAGLYLHNMLFFYAFAFNLTWLIYPSARPWTLRLKEAALADVLAALPYMIWVPSLLHQMQIQVVNKGFWATRPTFQTLFTTLSLVAGFLLDYLLAVAVRVSHLSPAIAWISVLFGVAGLSIAMLLGGLWRVTKEDRRKNIALLCYALVPMVGVFWMSRASTPLFTDRIFTNSSVIFPIVFAFPLATQKTVRSRTVFGILAVILGVVLALSGFGYLRNEQKEDWRGATLSIVKNPENKVVVFVARTGEILFDYYTTHFSGARPPMVKIGLPVGYSESFPPPRVNAPIQSLDDITRLTSALNSHAYSEIDLVLSHEIYDDPHEFVLRYLEQTFSHNEEVSFYGIRVFRFFPSQP